MTYKRRRAGASCGWGGGGDGGVSRVGCLVGMRSTAVLVRWATVSRNAASRTYETAAATSVAVVVVGDEAPAWDGRWRALASRAYGSLGGRGAETYGWTVNTHTHATCTAKRGASQAAAIRPRSMLSHTTQAVDTLMTRPSPLWSSDATSAIVHQIFRKRNHNPTLVSMVTLGK